jgi:hypothetical protein
MTNPPSYLTYSSVVARDSIRLAFLIAALNDLEIMMAEIGNAYLNATTNEKGTYFVPGLWEALQTNFFNLHGSSLHFSLI